MRLHVLQALQTQVDEGCSVLAADTKDVGDERASAPERCHKMNDNALYKHLEAT